jgi:protein-disulfide isomerase
MPLRLSFFSLAFASALAAAVLPHSLAAADMTASEREAIEAVIHDYLMHNPDVLIEALRGAEDKLNHEADSKAATVLSDRRSEIFDDPMTPVGGNPRGDVTIVEFFDYRCPYCKQVLPTLQTLLKEDRELRFIYKEMPVLGPASIVAARAALAAQRQGKYEAFHAAMMGTKGQISEDAVYKVAASVGLDVGRLKQDMTAPDIERALKANLALAEALNIRGTPGFVIGQHIIPGVMDLEAIKSMIADARKG